MNAISRDALRDLAPNGTIRAGINFGNSALALGPVETPSGISIDLSRELARRVGVDVTFVPYASAKALFEDIETGRWDVAFMAVEPARMNVAVFTQPYMVIEGAYLVMSSAPYQTPEDLDRQGIRIGTAVGTAYTLFLERNLKAAEIVTANDGIEVFRSQGLDAAAGIRQQIAQYARQNQDVRVLDTPFMEIPQAMAISRHRIAGAAYLRDFIEDVCASGFVGERLER